MDPATTADTHIRATFLIRSSLEGTHRLPHNLVIKVHFNQRPSLCQAPRCDSSLRQRRFTASGASRGDSRAPRSAETRTPAVWLVPGASTHKTKAELVLRLHQRAGAEEGSEGEKEHCPCALNCEHTYTHTPWHGQAEPRSPVFSWKWYAGRGFHGKARAATDWRCGTCCLMSAVALLMPYARSRSITAAGIKTSLPRVT